MRLAGLGLMAAIAVFAQVKLPSYTRQELPNGVVVYLLPRAGLPLVNFRVLVRGGAESDPLSLAGLSDVTGDLLRKGNGSRTSDQFSDQLDSLGGLFQTGSDEQATVITAEFLKKDFGRGLELLSDAVLRPTFPVDEVRKLLAQNIDRVKSMKDDPQEAIMPYYRGFFFGRQHPYGRVPDESSYDRIRREEVLRYHRQMYVGKNLIVIVSGDFDPEVARTQITAAFGSAPAGTAYSWAKDTPLPSTGGPRVLLVDKPEATQTYFVIAQPGIRRDSPDRVPLTLVNTLFGDRFTSMLNDELRVNSGLSYGARSRLQESKLTGGLVISTFTKTESTGQAIDLALAVLNRLIEKGITADQLASAKAYLKGTFPPRKLETSDQLAAMLGEMELFGLGRDEVDQFFQRIDAVTLERANQLVRQYYHADNLTFVLLGDAGKIRKLAAKYGPKVVEKSVVQAGW